jgi:hypothetical protein
MEKKNNAALIMMLYALLVVPSWSIAQVSIAPTTIFTNSNGIATCYITNPSDSPQEVDVSFVFGYPAYNEEGELNMVYGDSLYESKMGLGDQIRAFPRSFILQPFQQQIVRIQVRPNRNKPDGMYFTRLKIATKIQTADAGTSVNTEISSKINFRFEQIIAVFSPQGNVTTSLELGDIHYEREGTQVHVVSDYKVGGNAPYLGTVRVQLKDPQNQAVAEQRQTVALYFDSRHRVSINLPDDFAPGDFDLEVSYTTERTDIKTSDIVQATPTTRIFRVNIPFLGSIP